MKVNSTGLVLPQGQPVTTLNRGEHVVAIDVVCDDGLIRCVYPDGFVKHHQAESIDDLLSKVTSQLRGRYGVADVKFNALPKVIADGELITVEI